MTQQESGLSDRKPREREITRKPSAQRKRGYERRLHNAGMRSSKFNSTQRTYFLCPTS